MDSEDLWFYSVNGVERNGQISSSELKALYENGAIPGSSLVWRKGFDKWVPLCETNLVEDIPPPLDRLEIGLSDRRFICPACGSTNIARSSIVFEQGTTVSVGSNETRTLTTYSGWDSGDVRSKSSETGSTESFSKTLLAEKVAPPSPPGNLEFRGCLGAGCFSLVILAVIFVFVASLLDSKGASDGWIWAVSLGVVGLLGFLIFRGLGKTYLPSNEELEKERSDYESKLSDWKKEWICLRCENRWKRDADHPPPADGSK